MFEDFSFQPPSRQRVHYSSLQMEDSVSPNSSRESSPCYENGYNGTRQYSRSNSIAELSRRFNQHSLNPRRPSTVLEDTPPRSQGPSPCVQSPNSFSNRVCRRRQSINRLQCSPAHLSRIKAFVEDMVQTGHSCCDSPYSSTMLGDSTFPSLSPDEQEPTSNPYFGFTPMSASAAGIRVDGPSSAQRSPRHSQPYKTDKELRHSGSREGMGKLMVKKPIRVRKSAKSLSKASGKRCER